MTDWQLSRWSFVVVWDTSRCISIIRSLYWFLFNLKHQYIELIKSSLWKLKSFFYDIGLSNPFCLFLFYLNFTSESLWRQRFWLHFSIFDTFAVTSCWENGQCSLLIRSFQCIFLVWMCLKSTRSLSQQINWAVWGVYPAALVPAFLWGLKTQVFVEPLTLRSKIWLWLSPLQAQTDTKCGLLS